MIAPVPHRLSWLAVAVLLGACSAPAPQPDAGTPDAGIAAPACDSPEDCRAQQFDGVCRQGLCRADVPCGDDAECGIGEACVGGACRFTGCVSNDDCEVGTCRTDVFACTECAQNTDCPAALPVCSPQGRCVACQADSDCGWPGPAYCDAPTGACVHCKSNDHCPQGLNCGNDGVCYGAQKNQACNNGIACDLGLTCVNVGSNTLCLEACNVYVPTCPQGEICLKLTFADSPSLVFDQGAPVGVCYTPIQGLRGYHEPCVDNCQPNLECIPDSPTQSTCKSYCDPANPICAPNEKCHPFPGDWSGHQYGLCYQDTGYGAYCTSEGDCRAGLSCVPRDDPAASNDLSNFCAWDVGTKAALEACASNSECQTGQCRSEAQSGPATFCFAACTEDAHCSVGTRKGVCDGKFSFTTEYVTANVAGCRPACDGPADCTEYGGSGDTCRLRINAQQARVVQTCGAAYGVGVVGDVCSSDADCESQFCQRRDGRGVFRQGVCSTPCINDGECQGPSPTDGGAALAGTCGAVALFAHPGPDGTVNTVDDRHAVTNVCGGGGCTRDADCDGPWSVCAPDADPQNAVGNLVTACRTPSSGSKVAGDSCTFDLECRSGACAEIGTTGQRTCLQLCTVGATDCATNLTCTTMGARLARADGTFQTFDACLP